MEQKSANVGSHGRRSVPGRRLHKASGLAVVTLNGHDHYLGDYDDPTSRRKYDELIMRWLAGGRRPLHTPKGDGWPTVEGLAEGYRKWAEGYYVKAGRPTSFAGRVGKALDDLVGLYGSEPTDRFGGAQLETLRDYWVGTPGRWGKVRCRRTVEESARVVRNAFRWGVNRGMAPAEGWMALQAVERLPRGRSGAREGRKVGPAPPEAVEAVLARLTPSAAALLRAMMLTGMRPGEACGMRAADVDRSGEVWRYKVAPEINKTEHRGKERVVAIGPRAQSVIGPWIAKAGKGTVFPTRSGAANNPRKLYMVVWKWCRKLGVEHWHPNQLRHSAATAVRKVAGLEGAQVILGHSRADVTQCYAEANWDRAEKIALEMG